MSHVTYKRCHQWVIQADITLSTGRVLREAEIIFPDGSLPAISACGEDLEPVAFDCSAERDEAKFRCLDFLVNECGERDFGALEMMRQLVAS